MKLKVSLSVALIAPLFALMSFASCSGGGDSDKVVLWVEHGPPDSIYLNLIVDAYNATNPDVQVKFVQVPGSLTEVTSLMTAVRGGTGPDVYLLDRFTVAQRASDGLLEDITDMLNEQVPGFSANYVPWAWDEVLWRGKVYGLPFDNDSRGLYYNKNLLRDAGIDPAELDWHNGPVTLSRLTEIAHAMDTKDSAGNYTTIGFVPQSSEGWHYTWGFIFGGKFADLAAGKVTPTDPGVVAAYQYLYDYNKELGPRNVQTFLSTYNPPNNAPQNNPFLTGHLAMFISGDYFLDWINLYSPPGSDFDVTYLPVVNEGDSPTTWSGGFAVVMPIGSKKKEAALKFMLYMAGEEGQRIFSTHKLQAPTWASIMDDPSLGLSEFFQQNIKFATSRPPLPVGALYWDALSSARDMVVQNVLEPLPALQEVERQIQPQLDKFLPLQ